MPRVLIADKLSPAAVDIFKTRGVDFDEAVLAHVNHASGGVLDDLDLRDPTTSVALARLRQDCVLAKEALSVDTETVVPVFLPGRHFDVTITRGELEDMVRAPLETTVSALSRTLRSAHVDPSELSAVLLVGGSSRIPLVAEMPHGGFKHSGYGKDLSMYGFEDYTRVKHVMANLDS